CMGILPFLIIRVVSQSYFRLSSRAALRPQNDFQSFLRLRTPQTALTRFALSPVPAPASCFCHVDRTAKPPHHMRPLPESIAVAGLSHRQTEILNIARAFGRVMVEDLARRFEVSAQTIRKDLNDLCDQRSLTRIHGGAIIASGVENLAYEARRFVAAEE